MRIRRKTKAIGQKRQTQNTGYSLYHSLVPSFIGLLVCMVCLISTTWAWFTVSIESKGGVIKAANYDVEVTIVKKNGETEGTENVVAVNEGKSYHLTANTEYTITLKAVGTASTGYCVMQAGERTYHTEQIAPESTLSFQFIPEMDCDVSFAAQWGTYSGMREINPNATIGNLVPASEGNDESDAVQSQGEEKEDSSALEEQGESLGDTVSDEAVSETSGETDSTENQPEQTTVPSQSKLNTQQQEEIEEPTGKTEEESVGETVGNPVVGQTSDPVAESGSGEM